MDGLTPQFVFAFLAGSTALGILLNALELLSMPKEFRKDEGTFCWGKTYPIEWVRLAKIVAPVCDSPFVIFFLATRVILAIATLINAFTGPISPLVVTPLFLSAFIHNFRFKNINGGSDTMAINSLFVTTLYSFAPDNHSVAFACMLYISVLACLSYFANGYKKVKLPQWREPDILYRIFTYSPYRAPIASKLIKRFPAAGTWSCRCVLLIEVLFPLVLITGKWGALVFLSWGVLFHVMNATLMGLHRFVWTFVATYPAIIYVAMSVGY